MFLSFMAYWAYSASINEGCPDVKMLEPFQIDGFFGRWFVALNTEKDTSDVGLTGDCALYNFSLRHDFLIEVRNHAQDSASQHEFNTVGRAKWIELPRPILDLKTSPFAPWRSYKILETDYTHYAVVHTCSVSMGAWTKQETQVLVRSPQEVGSRGWRAQAAVAKGAIERAFTDSAMASQVFHGMHGVVQGRLTCQYPAEPDYSDGGQETPA